MVADSETPQSRGDPSQVAMRVVNIDVIVQPAGSFELDPERMPQSGSAMLPIHDHGHADVEQQGDRVVVALEYAFAAAVASEAEVAESELEETEPFFACRAKFVVAYQLESEEAFAQADLQAFAEINGRLNTVPYWREFLHNTLARAGLPMYEVPPFNPMQLIRKNAHDGVDD